jgi:hypothetical protein
MPRNVEDKEESRLKHNALVPDICAMLITQFPDHVDRIIAVESIIVGVFSSLPMESQGDKAMIDLITKGAMGRLLAWRFTKQDQTQIPKG